MIRTGDWRPGATSPALLAVELLTAGQAALRGIAYLRGDAVTHGGVVDYVESAAPTAVWGWLFFGSATAVLVGLAGRWPGVLVAAHLLLGAVYAGLGFAVLRIASGPPSLVGVLGTADALLGVYVVLRARSLPVRLLLGVPLLVAGGVALSVALGTEYATGSGFVIGGGVQVALAVGVWHASTRQRLQRIVDREAGRA